MFDGKLLAKERKNSQSPPQPHISVPVLLLVTVVFLKLISYKQVNSALRCQLMKKKSVERNETDTKALENGGNNSVSITESDDLNGKTPQQATAERKEQITETQNDARKLMYPENLTIRNMYYFLICPTLCYELEYPLPLPVRVITSESEVSDSSDESEIKVNGVVVSQKEKEALGKRQWRIHWWFLGRRVLEAVSLSLVILAFFQQWIMPALINSNELFLTMDYMRLVEKLLKLAVPNQILWLLFFYLFFHSTLNALAEVTGFGDREFYLDWWNSRNQAEFWQKWNIPVHKWGKRHVYKPLLQRGFSKIQASIFVFLVSAFFHEYLVSVPLKVFRLWIFLGMMAQVPLAVVSMRLTARQGNILMWLSLIMGQPAVVFMYYHDYYVTHLLTPANT